MSKRMEIDVATFKKLLADKKINVNKLSEELGYRRDYITKSCRLGKLGIVCIKAIENKYNIPYEKYAPIGQTTPVTTTESEKTPKPPYSVLDMKSIIKNKVGKQALLADKIGRSNSYLSSWLSGKSEITAGDILNIASALNIRPTRIPTKFEVTEPKEMAEYNSADGIELLLKRIDKLEEALYSLASYLNRSDENILKLTKYTAFIAKQMQDKGDDKNA
jgi:transcriptional regulator with XRE-family HTH domain